MTELQGTFSLAVGSILLLLLLILIFKYQKVLGENNWLRDQNIILAWFDHRLPLGSRFYFDKQTNNLCQRCNVGSITRRYRYKIIAGEKGEPVVYELTGIFWCGGCDYRGLSLKKSI